MNITVILKDGTVKKFKHEGRASGSYTKSIKYEGEFAVITDEWHNTTAIPARDIVEIRTTPYH